MLALIEFGPLSVAAPDSLDGFGVSLSASSVTGDAPLLIRFLATPSAGASPAVQWSFGDGSVLFGNGSASLSPSHWYEAPGAFDVEVILSSGTEVARANLTIRVSPAIVGVQVTATREGSSAPQTVELNATPTGGTGTYVGFAWVFGDGGVGTGPSVRYTFAHDGSFHVVVGVTDSAGDRGSGSIWINLSDPASAAPGGPATGWNSALATDWPYVAGGLLALVGLWSLSIRPRRAEAPAASTAPSRTTGTPEAASVTVHPPAGPPGPPGPQDPGPRELPVDAARSAVPPPRHEPVDQVGRSPRGWREVADLIIVRLGGLGDIARGEIPSAERTQRGLAEALGVEQNVVSKVLARLAAAEVVVVRTRHVQGLPKRRKTYELTPRGEELASKLRRPAGVGGGYARRAGGPSDEPPDGSLRVPRSS